MNWPGGASISFYVLIILVETFCAGAISQCSNQQECIPVGCVPAERWTYSGWRPPEKLETPQKIGDPPKNWRSPKKLEIPPKKLETPPQKIGDPPEKLETPLWTERMTDDCENITLAKTSFRPVITMDFDYVYLLGMSCLLSILMVLLCSALDCNETSRTWNRPIAKPHSGVTQRRLFPFKKSRLTHPVYLLFLETRLQRTNILVL